MWPETSGKDRIAVEHEVLRGDCGCDFRVRALDELNSLLGCNVLQNYSLRSGKSRMSGCRMLSMKTASRSNTSTLARSDLPVDAKHQPNPLHPLEHSVNVADVCDTARAIGRRPRRVQLCSDPHAFLEPALDLVGSSLIRKIAGHQRLEPRACGIANTPAIFRSCLGASHGRNEVRHDDRPRELSRGARRNAFQHLPVAKMDVPIVWSANGQRLRSHEPVPN